MSVYDIDTTVEDDLISGINDWEEGDTLEVTADCEDEIQDLLQEEMSAGFGLHDAWRKGNTAVVTVEVDMDDALDGLRAEIMDEVEVEEEDDEGNTVTVTAQLTDFEWQAWDFEVVATFEITSVVRESDDDE